MKENLPLIHIFKSVDKYYFYDTDKHKVVKLSQEIYKLLEQQIQSGIKVSHPALKNLEEKGFLSLNRIEEIISPAENMVEYILKNKISKICLQVSQQCNFRCSYCVYSDEYENRNHSSKKMNWTTAKKGIDLLIDHSKDSPELEVGFYGGEPLLEFDLINECLKYASKVAEGKKVSFTITTNGSLLNEDMVRTFLKYDMTVSVSLDGPREIHDKNRKFAANGRGTFDQVYNNLKTVIKKYPEFKKRLQFSMVIDPTINMNCLAQFISAEDLFNERGVAATLIKKQYRKNELDYNLEFIRDWEYNKFRYFLSLLGKVSSQNEKNTFISVHKILIDFIADSNQSFTTLGKQNHPSGPCIPGQTRLFLNVDGDLYPCERVNETSHVMKIGSIDGGFEFDKIRNLLNIGKLTEEECKNCFAFRGCFLCAAAADKGDQSELSKELKLLACAEVRYTFEEMLKDACTLKELGITNDMVQTVRS